MLAVGVSGAVLAVSLCILAAALCLPLHRSRSNEQLATRVVRAARDAGVTLVSAGSKPGARRSDGGGGGGGGVSANQTSVVVQLQPLSCATLSCATLSLPCAKPCDGVVGPVPSASLTQDETCAHTHSTAPQASSDSKP